MNIKQDANVTTILLSILFGGILFWIINYCWKMRRLYYYGSKIKGPFTIPPIGNPYYSLKFVMEKYQTIMEISDKYKPVGKLWLLYYLLIIVSRPEYVEILLRSCLDKAQPYEYFKVSFGEGLFTASVDKWKRHKKLMNLTFNQNILKSYMDIFVKHANKLRDDLKECCDYKQIDIFAKFAPCSLGIICETTMGVDLAEYKKHNQNSLSWTSRGEELMASRLYNPLYHIDFLWNLSSAAKEIKSLSTKAMDYIRKVIETKRRTQLSGEKADNFEKKDFLDHLMKITDEDGKWTTQELIDEVSTMYFGGSDTSSVTQSFVMLMLSIHPQFQEILYDELDTIFGNSNRDVTYDDLDRMVYLEQVIKETMRLFPIAPAILRSVAKDVVLDSYVIPKGSTLLIPIAYIQRDPEIWHDPLKFDPDRFLPEEVLKRHRCSYMPFSIPPRNCIGITFAMMSMKVTLSTILRQFKVVSSQYSSIDDIKLQMTLLLSAPNGYKVILEPRQNK